MMNAREIRESYLKFFEGKDHLRLPSYSLVPVNDPTLLIIGAGMAPLKPYFKGEAKPPYPRITTCQKCFRADDIEYVGKTARHHSFFEMLGNFSLGDYFKKEACAWAWEYFTEWMKFDPELLYITIHTDDDEAYRIWTEEVGIPPHKISRLKDNFWGPIGATGPCGPCSELLIDQGEEFGCGSPDCKPGCDCDRYLELWNLVFTGLNKNEKGEYEQLPKPCIDTGLGLERTVAYFNKKKNAFETELFTPIINKLEEISGIKLGDSPATDTSIKIIADHTRAVIFMASDGITPSNEGRGYVMRRILRRAVRLAGQLGFGDRSLAELIDPLVEYMCHIYPELKEKRDFSYRIITTEEENFKKTLNQGIVLLDNILDNLSKQNINILPGKDLFSLYDTYGFPPELTGEIAKEKGFSVDTAGFEKAMEEQRQRAKSAREEMLSSLETEMDLSSFESQFTGYSSLEERTKVLAIFKDGKKTDTVKKGEKADIVLEKTPLYGESGGQTGDTGTFETTAGSLGEIYDTRKTPSDVHLHRIIVKEGILNAGDSILVTVTSERRKSIMRHHTATHLLQSALRKILGNHVGQMGSQVEEDRFRFDFSHHQAMTQEEIELAEKMVTEKILENIPVKIEQLPVSEALHKGALAFFGEKYGDKVRVVSIPDFSTELCGGTHVKRTGDIGAFKIVSESAIGMGIRRIEGVCGLSALERAVQQERMIKQTSRLLNCDEKGIPDAITKLKENSRSIAKELQTLKAEYLSLKSRSDAIKVHEIHGVRCIIHRQDDLDRDALRNMADILSEENKADIVVLGTLHQEKVALLVRVSKNLTNKGVSAVPILKETAGGGGGKPHLAQFGGKDPSTLEQALEKAYKVIADYIEEKV